eukprot:scaffold96719_cov28-Tisochrysis_lutea.AAC.1
MFSILPKIGIIVHPQDMTVQCTTLASCTHPPIRLLRPGYHRIANRTRFSFASYARTRALPYNPHPPV